MFFLVLLAFAFLFLASILLRLSAWGSVAGGLGPVAENEEGGDPLRGEFGLPPGGAGGLTRDAGTRPKGIEAGMVDAWKKGSSFHELLVITGFVVNIAVLLGLQFALGGTAINGKVVSGHYFLGEHRNYHEVSAATFSWCKAIESAALVFFLGSLAYVALHFMGACLLHLWQGDGRPYSVVKARAYRSGWVAGFGLQGLLAAVVATAATTVAVRLFHATDFSRGLLPALMSVD